MNIMVIAMSFFLILTGLGYLYRPEYISKFNTWVKDNLFNDRMLIIHRTKIGMLLILTGVIIFYIAVK